MKNILKIEEKNVLELLWNFVHTLKNEDFTLYELLDALQERSFGILLLLMALPNALMITVIPGISALIGIALILISLQMIQCRQKPWFPQRIGHKIFPKKTLETILTVSTPYLQPIERHLKSRGRFLLSSYFERFIGFVCLLHSVLIALPIPLGNLLPGIALVLLSLGIIAKDGVYIIIGLIVSLAVFIFFTLAFGEIVKFVQGFIG